LSNGTLWSNKSGSIKERTQTRSEISTGCQRNVYWLATNHLLDRGLVQLIKELSSATGRCAGKAVH